MNLHEFQAKNILQKNGLPVAPGYLATNPWEAYFAFQRLGEPEALVKAQIHAGGRGKAGGIKKVSSPHSAFEAAEKLFKDPLVTHQTGAQGKIVRSVYVEASRPPKKEYYLALLVDRKVSEVTLVFSHQGGMEIEEVARQHPEAILTLPLDANFGFSPYVWRSWAKKIQISGKELNQLQDLVKNLYKTFINCDASLIEINPLGYDGERFWILDSKISLDDNALFRHKDLQALRDISEEDPRDVEAGAVGLNYVGLSGNIACLVNGAGLAMATMDILKHYGGEAANFLDVGGGASEEMIEHAMGLIVKDPHVKGVFINIFGGIMKCDVLAHGMVKVLNALAPKWPLAVRMEGTRVEEGRAILSQSSFPIFTAESMAQGAQWIVEKTRA